MESTNSESMLKILNECLEDSNLETVSKAELRKKYLEKTGLAKLPHEDKKLFKSAVNTAYLDYITKKTAAADKTNGDEASADETKENGDDWKLAISSSSDDDITPGNIKEDVICDLYTNGENDIKVESCSDLDEKSLASHKNNIIKKSPLTSGQRGKRALISSSEDEAIQPESTEKNKLLKKAKRCSDLEEEPITKSKKKKKVPQNINNQNRLRKATIESSDSEDEPLNIFQKKSDTLKGPLISATKSDELENEHLSKDMKKQVCNPVNFEDELIMSSTKKKTKLIDHSSSSEDEPLKIFQKSTDYIHSNHGKGNFETKVKSNGSRESLKSEGNSSDSDNEPLTKYRDCNSSVHSDDSNSFSKKKNSSKKLCRLAESESSSEDEYLAKHSKKVNNSVSSDSENEPLNSLGNKKKFDSGKKPSEKTVERKVKHSLKKSSSSNSKSKDASKKKMLISSEDDSDEQPIATLAKISYPVNNFQSSNESDDELLSNLSNKKTQHSSNSEKETVKKVVKKKIKDSFKKSPTNNKSIEQSLKKKKYINSDEVANSSKQKKKIMNGQIDSLLSDSSEEEPLSHINKPNYSRNSKDERNILNQKEEKSFLLSESSEDEPLSNMTKKVNGSTKKVNSSSDSEDEALSKLATENSDKKQKNSGSCSSSFVDENEEQSSGKKKQSKRKEANDSVKGKKRPSASENKIEHLKKYLRVAGIRISNYNKLFENCKSMKAKCEKMMSLLEKEGLKGRPTLEKCKKLRVKIETKREIAELDVSNILKDGGGRPKRSVCSDTTNCKQEEAKTTPIKKFSRLQDIVDSEESD